MPSFFPTGLVSAGFAVSQGERRAKVRYTCRLKGTYRALGGPQAAQDALILDASESGLRLLMGVQQKRGTILSVAVEGGQERLARGVLVKVVQCRKHEGDLWAVGCRFVKPLEEAELLALLHASVRADPTHPPQPVTPGGSAIAGENPRQTVTDTASSQQREETRPTPASAPVDAMSAANFAAPMGGAEKRRSPRRGSGLAVVHISRTGAWGKPTEGWVINKSLGGMCLCSPRRFDEGTLLKVAPKRRSSEKAEVELHVLHVRQEGARYILHCQFVSHVPAHVLQRFV